MQSNMSARIVHLCLALAVVALGVHAGPPAGAEEPKPVQVQKPPTLKVQKPGWLTPELERLLERGDGEGAKSYLETQGGMVAEKPGDTKYECSKTGCACAGASSCVAMVIEACKLDTVGCDPQYETCNCKPK